MGLNLYNNILCFIFLVYDRLVKPLQAYILYTSACALDSLQVRKPDIASSAPRLPDKVRAFMV